MLWSLNKVLSTYYSLRKCMEISLENLQVGIGAYSKGTHDFPDCSWALYSHWATKRYIHTYILTNLLMWLTLSYKASLQVSQKLWQASQPGQSKDIARFRFMSQPKSKHHDKLGTLVKFLENLWNCNNHFLIRSFPLPFKILPFCNAGLDFIIKS